MVTVAWAQKWDRLTASSVFHLLCPRLSAHLPNRRCQFFQTPNSAFWKENTPFSQLDESLCSLKTDWQVKRLDATHWVLHSPSLCIDKTSTFRRSTGLQMMFQSTWTVHTDISGHVSWSIMLLFQFGPKTNPLKKKKNFIVMLILKAKSCQSWNNCLERVKGCFKCNK